MTASARAKLFRRSPPKELHLIRFSQGNRERMARSHNQSMKEVIPPNFTIRRFFQSFRVRNPAKVNERKSDKDGDI
jgi:hypothetical protein